MIRCDGYRPESAELTLDEATSIVRGRGQGDLLKGMESIRDVWNDYCRNGDDRYEYDSDFFDNWHYEINAYNVIYEGMSKLLAPA